MEFRDARVVDLLESQLKDAITVISENTLTIAKLHQALDVARKELRHAASYWMSTDAEWCKRPRAAAKAIKTALEER